MAPRRSCWTSQNAAKLDFPPPVPMAISRWGESDARDAVTMLAFFPGPIMRSSGPRASTWAATSSQVTRDGGGSLRVNVTSGLRPSSFHDASGASMASLAVTARVTPSLSRSEPVKSSGSPTGTLERSRSISRRTGGEPSWGVRARVRGRTQRRWCRHRRTPEDSPPGAVPGGGEDRGNEEVDGEPERRDEPPGDSGEGQGGAGADRGAVHPGHVVPADGVVGGVLDGLVAAGRHRPGGVRPVPAVE